MSNLPSRKVGVEAQPLNAVQWLPRDALTPNGYNPNKVAQPEMKLLKLSILEDGWTQPIVANADMEIVDGFHRWTVSGDPQVSEMTDGLIPVVVLEPQDADHQMMSTIRHNRARGTHGVLNMAKIIQSMVDDGLSKEEMQRRMGMEEEEIIRLALRVGIPESDLISNSGFDKAWVPE